METLSDDEIRQHLASAIHPQAKRLRLFCGTCEDAASLEPKRGYSVHEPAQSKHHGRASVELFKLGWRWTDRPICPECIRRGKLS